MVGKTVVCKLKWGMEYKGSILILKDSYAHQIYI